MTPCDCPSRKPDLTNALLELIYLAAVEQCQAVAVPNWPTRQAANEQPEEPQGSVDDSFVWSTNR